MSDKLAKMESGTMGAPLPSPAELLNAVIQKGVTSDNVQVVEKLIGLAERMEARDAERAFNRAFTQLQKEIPKIKADKSVADGKGGVLYRYCSYEEIHDQVQPILAANGFSVRFSQRMEEGKKIVAICHLMHESGHSVTSEYAVRSGRGAPGMNETKEDASASTIAQREALCDALNIIRRGRDSDPRNEGGTVTAEQAKELAERVQLTNSDRTAFLKFAGAEDFGKIAALKYDMLDQFLQKRERKGK